MKDDKYWIERAELLEGKTYKDTTKFLKDLNGVYEQNVTAIEKEIHYFVNKYATENGLSFAEASKNLTSIEFSDYRRQMNNLIGEYNRTGSEKLLARIRELEARSVVTRLDAIKNQIELRMDILAEELNGQVEGHLQNVYEKAYLTTGEDISVGLSVEQAFTTADLTTIQEVLKYPYSGMLFSDRIWKCTDKLNSSIIEVLQTSLVQGKSIPQISKALKEKLTTKGVKGYSNYDVTRVVRTETMFILEQAQHDANTRYGFTKYKIITAHDERTCRKCAPHDMEEHLEEERMAGVTAPPFHPLCRCCTAPVATSLQT